MLWVWFIFLIGEVLFPLMVKKSHNLCSFLVNVMSYFNWKGRFSLLLLVSSNVIKVAWMWMMLADGFHTPHTDISLCGVKDEALPSHEDTTHSASQNTFPHPSITLCCLQPKVVYDLSWPNTTMCRWPSNLWKRYFLIFQILNL